MLLSDFDYALPPELIAQEPLADRAASRMLVVDRTTGRWEDRTFRDLPQYLRPGDCLVLNDSKVFPARLLGHRAGFQGEIETLLLRPTTPDRRTWECLVHPGKKVRTGEILVFSDNLRAEVIGRNPFGERLIRFISDADPAVEIDRVGHVPLPPYIRRGDDPGDRERYQTIYARERGSAAAPTAGLHFTPRIIEECRAAGADVATVTLHVGLGTFQPLRTEVLDEATLHAESYSVESLSAIQSARRRVAVGTTTVRTLETIARTGKVSGETDLFIRPGFEFRLTGAMLTNFHLPRSSLLVLVCAFAGKELALSAYRHAVESQYRFYSYGDCMLIV